MLRDRVCVCVRVSPAERPQGRGDFAQTRQDYVGRRGFCRAGSWHVDCTEARGARCVRWRTEARTAGEGPGATAQRGQTRAGSLEHKSDVHGDSLAGAGGLRRGNCQLLLVVGGLRLRHRRRDLPKSRGRAPSAPVLTNTGVTNLHFGGAVDGDEDGGLHGGPSQGGGCGWRSWRSSSSGLSGWATGHWALAPSPRKSWWPTRCHHPCASPHPLSGRGLLGVRLH